MLSRTAENLFWMGRYMERADATARLIGMGYRMAMLPGSNEMDEWRSVAAASGSAPDIAEAANLKAGEVVGRLLLASSFTNVIVPLRNVVSSVSGSGPKRGRFFLLLKVLYTRISATPKNEFSKSSPICPLFPGPPFVLRLPGRFEAAAGECSRRQGRQKQKSPGGGSRAICACRTFFALDSASTDIAAGTQGTLL